MNYNLDMFMIYPTAAYLRIMMGGGYVAVHPLVPSSHLQIQ